MADNPDSIDEIKAQLAHPEFRERQAALEKIKGLLDQNEQVRPCVTLLLEVIDTNENLVVADQARKILDDWQGRDQMGRTQGDQTLIFSVICPQCGFQNYYDKHQVCGGQGSILLGKGEDQTDEYLLDCQSCHESFVVQFNCEGYK